jgi:hypothetical protein
MQNDSSKRKEKKHEQKTKKKKKNLKQNLESLLSFKMSNSESHIATRMSTIEVNMVLSQVTKNLFPGYPRELVILITEFYHRLYQVKMILGRGMFRFLEICNNIITITFPFIIILLILFQYFFIILFRKFYFSWCW